MNIRQRVETIEKNERAYRAVESFTQLINALKDGETNITVSKELEYFAGQAERVLNECGWTLITARRAYVQLMSEFADVPSEDVAERVSKRFGVSPEQIMADVARDYRVNESMLM